MRIIRLHTLNITATLVVFAAGCTSETEAVLESTCLQGDSCNDLNGTAVVEESLRLSDEDPELGRIMALPETRARNYSELRAMRAYIKSRYSDDDVLHRFLTDYGKTIDCIDFYDQAAVRKSARRYQLSSTPPPELDRVKREFASRTGILRSKETSSDREELFDQHGRKRGCPEGTVPLLRKELADLAHFETLDSYLRKPGDPGKALAEQAGGDGLPTISSHFHGAKKTEGINAKSVQAVFNVWDPYIEYKGLNNNDWDGEFSLSQLWILRTPDDKCIVDRQNGSACQTIESGWIKYPHKLGDYPAFFIFYTPNGYRTACWNHNCDYFHQFANTKTVLGGKIKGVSVKNGTQKEFGMLWYNCTDADECGANLGWYLLVVSEEYLEFVGWIERSTFANSGLRNKAELIQFGGEVYEYKPDNKRTRTDMGTGAYPNNCAGGDDSPCYRKVAYQRSIKFMNTNGVVKTPALSLNRIEAPACYNARTYLRSDDDYWGRHVYFGGQGHTDSNGCN